MTPDKSTLTTAEQLHNREHYKAHFFYVNTEDECLTYDRFIQSNPSILVVDKIYEQIVDLVKIRNVRAIVAGADINELVLHHLGGRELEFYGVWVYFPWRNMVVHLLDKQEFLEVKTNRNRNKITADEQALLLTKRVGVIGLSVGQSVATTMVMERCLGEIRIADFDTLDLSNCNRLRVGVHNIGISKALITAREIAELDPYVEVTVFEHGISSRNIDDFYTSGGVLDLVVEECDSLDIKVLARQKAKEYRVPLLMEMSDKGMIDVERYDNDAEYSMFHGAVQHLDLSQERLQKLTIEERMAYLYPMVGGNNVSERLLASAQEVGKTLLTWPQLASSVILGGGISTDVIRRIFLGQFHSSGRFYVDLEQIISDKK
jgi:molybdopterin/thiamine biosynthesis adenylyltransferase